MLGLVTWLGGVAGPVALGPWVPGTAVPGVGGSSAAAGAAARALGTAAGAVRASGAAASAVAGAVRALVAAVGAAVGAKPFLRLAAVAAG